MSPYWASFFLKSIALHRSNANIHFDNCLSVADAGCKNVKVVYFIKECKFTLV